MEKFDVLYEFIDRAVKSRKYPDNTAYGLKAAVKLFEAELKEEEIASLEKFKTNFDRIYRAVFAKNKQFAAASLEVYKSRVRKVLNDYEKYGTDPAKMANWTPKVITRSKRSVPKPTGTEVADTPISSEISVEAPIGTQRIEHPLRPGAKIIIILPQDATSSDIEKAKTLLGMIEVKE